MSKTGQALAEFAKAKKGTPYFYGAKFSDGFLLESTMSIMHRMYPTIVTIDYICTARRQGQVGKINVDCSGLIAGYRNKNIGSSQLYSTAYTRLPIAKVKDFAIGTVLWKSGHVGVYIGTVNGVPMCMEAKGIKYGTILSKVSATPWKCGLTFSDMLYEYTTNLSKEASWKSTNPYKEPTSLIKKGSKEEAVKWVQYELVEAGFGVAFMYDNKEYKAIKVDGEAGDITIAAILAFQRSCKIQEDGLCGANTRKYLKANI